MLFGGLVVAGLDILYAIVFWRIRGAAPIKVFQGVAAGLLGREAFEAGVPAAVLGGLLHVFNALVIVAIYHLASRRLTFLARRPVPWGMLYGVGVCLVMTYIVIPLSASPSRLPSLPVLATNLVSHVLLVGLPCALFARAASRERGRLGYQSVSSGR
jgi:hypothetical protein